MNLKRMGWGAMLMGCWLMLGASLVQAEANLATGKKATASSQWSGDYAPALAVDGKPETRWLGD